MTEYVLALSAGDVGASHSVNSPTFIDFTPAQLLFLSFRLEATRVSGTGVATLTDKITWYDSTGTAIATTTSHTTNIDATTDSYIKLTHLPPANAKSGILNLTVAPAASPMQHNIAITKLRLGKTELFATAGADWGSNVTSRPANLSGLTGTEPIKNADLNLGVTLTPVSGTYQIISNSIQLLSADFTWGHSAYALEPMRGTAVVSWSGNVADGGLWFAGLTDNPTAVIAASSDVEAQADFAFYHNAAGVISVYASGVGYSFGAATGLTDNAVFTITYDGTKVKFFVNGQLVSTQTTTSDRTLYFVFYPWAQNAKLRNIKLGQFAAPDWANNVQGRPANLSALVGTEGVKNSDVSIGSNGALAGGGGGQVTLPGLGHLGYTTSGSIINDETFNPNSWGIWSAGGSRQAAGNTNGFTAGVAPFNLQLVPQTADAGADSGNIAIEGSRTYTARVKVQRNAAATGTVSAWVFVYTAGGTFITGYRLGPLTTTDVSSGADPKEFTTSFTTPSTAKRAVVRLQTDANAAPAGAWRFESPAVVPFEFGATKGADWAGNVQNRPGNLAALAGGEGIKNSDLSIGSNGALSGGGGGQVTLNGIGGQGLFNGAANLLFNGSCRLLNSAGFPIGIAQGAGWQTQTVGGNEGNYIFTQTAGANSCNFDMVPVYATAQYELQAELWAATVTGGSLQVDVQWYASDKTTVVLDDGGFGTSSSLWGRQTHIYTAPSGAAYAQVRVFTQAVTFGSGGIVAARRIKFSRYDGYDVAFSDEKTNSVEGLTRQGTGIRVGDQRNLPAIAAANLRYKFTGTISYSATPTSATISVGAGSILLGSQTLSVNAMSATVSGSASTTVAYDLYITNPSFAGGSFTLIATNDANAIFSADDRMWLGKVNVSFPASGTGTGGGTTGGGGTNCVHEDSWVMTEFGFKQARDIEAGDWIYALTEDLTGTRWVEVVSNGPSEEPCYRLTSASGVELVCSAGTPLTLRDGSHVFPPDVSTVELPVWIEGQWDWELCEVASVDPATVQHIYCGGAVYAAGIERDGLIFTHNPVKQPSG